MHVPANNKFLLLFSLLTLFFCQILKAQTIYTHVSNTAIYDVIDELAALQVIEVNSATKPYTRMQIAIWLKIASKDTATLTERLKKEIIFYLQDYNKEIQYNKTYKKRIDAFYYKDSNFSVSINPIASGNLMHNGNKSAWQRNVGAECFAYIGKGLSIYGSLRDNNTTNVFFEKNHLVNTQAYAVKFKQGSAQKRFDFSDARGGISYGNKLGSIGIYKDHFVWGNNNKGAIIFSGLQPSFGFIQLKLHPIAWLEFNYINGTLVSGVLDSSSAYGTGVNKRILMRDKNITTNLFTIKPFKHTHISFGNSMIYSDVKFNVAYLIPFAFYKSIDHTYNNAGSNSLGQNSQLFFDVSSRYFKKIHLYSSLFVDEVNIKNIFVKSQQTNLFSVKAGFKIVNLIKNVQIIGEYTRTNPWVYSHPISTTTFESSLYSLGHYLKQNAQEIVAGLIVKPMRGLIIQVNYICAQKGEIYTYQRVAGTINVRGTPFINNTIWQQRKASLQVSYEIINDVFLNFQTYYQSSSGDLNTFTPSYLQTPFFIQTGFNVGF